MSVDNWFVISAPKRAPKLTLFCFPYAGGGIATYMDWHKYLADDVEVVFVQPPGRGTRLFEKPFDNMSDLMEELIDKILPQLNRPFAFFGHSLGSRIGYELVRQLMRLNAPTPLHFFASGSKAAHKREAVENWYLLPDDEFKDKLRELNGTPEEVLNNNELMDIIMPMIRADFKIADEYKSKSEPIHCPITVLGGTDDTDISVSDLEKWGELTTASSTVHSVEGDHFFIDKNPQKVLTVINDVLVAEIKNLRELTLC